MLHCDDKRTIAALKQYIIEATEEMQELRAQIALESSDEKKSSIQKRVDYLSKAISDSKDQLSSM